MANIKNHVTLTHERLLELLDYDQGTGIFTWKGRTGRGQHARNKSGCVAGSVNSKGYTTITVDGGVHRAHRLAWFFVHGVWPEHQIDHRDTVRHHNWIGNLREATGEQNAQNQRRPHRNNKSGFLGVSWDSGKEKWVPMLHVNGRNKRLGAFKTPEEAHQVYVRAKLALHPFATVGAG